MGGGEREGGLTRHSAVDEVGRTRIAEMRTLGAEWRSWLARHGTSEEVGPSHRSGHISYGILVMAY